MAAIEQAWLRTTWGALLLLRHYTFYVVLATLDPE